ncbi:MAG: hypothetical protein AAFV25_25085, partial [Bacteroidota bacterium]
YNWYDGDPTAGGNLISTDQTFTLSNLSAGTYTYHLQIDVEGCSAGAVPTTVTIQSPPTISPIANYTLAADCSPQDLTLQTNQLTGSTLVSYAWTGPNNFASSLANPTIPNVTTANNGTYNITVTDDNGCTASGSVQVINIADPVAVPIISSSGPACDGESITLSVALYQGSSVSYTWTTPAGTTVGISGLNTNQIVISPLDASIHDGDYSVTVVVDGCTLNSANFNIDAFDLPTVAPTFTATDTCDGGTINLFANASGSGALQYAWSGPNGFVSTLPNPVVTDAGVANNGTYSLTVTSGSACSAVGLVTVDVILAPAPIPGIDAVDLDICEGDTLFLSSSSTGTQFEWISTSDSPSSLAEPGMTTTTDNTFIPPGHPFYGSGPWRVRVTDANGCTQESETIQVNVYPIPTAVATNDGPHCEGASVRLLGSSTIAGASYLWYDGDPNGAPAGVLFSTTQNPVINNLTAGTYEYYLEVERNGCTSTAAMTQVQILAAPTVSISRTYDLAADCSADTLNLFSTPVGTAPFLYSWTGPNGFISSRQNPIIFNPSSASNGSYTLLVTDANGCTVTASLQISEIVDGIAQPIIQASGQACAGDAIRLTVPAYSGTSVDYVWSTPSGVTTSISGFNTPVLEIDPANAALHDGDYFVNVIVDGCNLQSDTFSVDVFDQPTAAPTATAGRICEGESLSLTANATGATTYSWTGPNAFRSTAQNPSLSNVTIANNGTYTLVVSNAN